MSTEFLLRVRAIPDHWKHALERRANPAASSRPELPQLQPNHDLLTGAWIIMQQEKKTTLHEKVILAYLSDGTTIQMLADDVDELPKTTIRGWADE